MLRVARDGGTLTAYAYPAMDSALWRSTSRLPALRSFVAFGAEDGFLAATDMRGAAVRVDLRLGTVSTSRDTALQGVTSADGAAIYALTLTGDITRFTPSGSDWKLKPTLPASALFAQNDGSLIVAGARGKQVVVWRVRPPGLEIVDTLIFTVGGDPLVNGTMIAATAGSVGDRVFFGANETVIAVRSRDMKKALETKLGDPIAAIAATPSGDRLFAATADNRAIRVVDRFEERVSDKIKLPAPATALRMDPLGRVLLARGSSDSVYVVSLGDNAVIGIVTSTWREDLPFVLADGLIALARGRAVVVTTPSLADGRTIARGGNEFWSGLRWNGFRPRATRLDEPVQFRTSAPRDSSDTRDGASNVVVDSTRPPTRDSTELAQQFTVAFASVQNEKQARDFASKIRVDGQSARITTIDRNGLTLYRVVLGPYASRAEADRVGRASGQSYWLCEGAP